MKRFRLLICMAVCLGILAILLLWFRRGQQLTAFRERLHMVERSLRVYQRENGKYPDQMSHLTTPGFKVEEVLSGSTYRYYNQPASSKSNQVLLDGFYRGHGFEVSSESGVSFK